MAENMNGSNGPKPEGQKPSTPKANKTHAPKKERKPRKAAEYILFTTVEGQENTFKVLSKGKSEKDLISFAKTEKLMIPLMTVRVLKGPFTPVLKTKTTWKV